MCARKEAENATVSCDTSQTRIRSRPGSHSRQPAHAHGHCILVMIAFLSALFPAGASLALNLRFSLVSSQEAEFERRNDKSRCALSGKGNSSHLLRSSGGGSLALCQSARAEFEYVFLVSGEPLAVALHAFDGLLDGTLSSRRFLLLHKCSELARRRIGTELTAHRHQARQTEGACEETKNKSRAWQEK